MATNICNLPKLIEYIKKNFKCGEEKVPFEKLPIEISSIIENRIVISYMHTYGENLHLLIRNYTYEIEIDDYFSIPLEQKLAAFIQDTNTIPF